eukprot:scaffold214347_cov17-Tisochrysis_lutea.AAC.1
MFSDAICGSGIAAGGQQKAGLLASMNGCEQRSMYKEASALDTCANADQVHKIGRLGERDTRPVARPQKSCTAPSHKNVLWH